jgi:hypothetical protein
MGKGIVMIQNTVLQLARGYWGAEAGCCERSNNRSGYIQSEEFVDQLSCYRLPKGWYQ